MISIRSSADMARALASPLDPPLRELLTLRRDQLLGDDDTDLGDLVHFIVVQCSDTVAAIEAEAGISIATNLVDGSKLGEPDFMPSFEWVERHGRWLEAVLVLTDDGFTVSLLVPDRIGVDPQLLILLCNHA